MSLEIAPCRHWNDHVNLHLQGQLIYKDECTKCFLTPKDEFGLNVCLKTFLGMCCNPAPGHNHWEAYYARNKNAIFMNIKLTPKAPPQGNSDELAAAQKITKLAIGKPGGIDADTDNYETSATVWCKLCDTELSMSHPAVASMADSILLASSAYNAGAVAEWELELSTCPCTNNLDQSLVAGVIDAKSMAKCAKCDLRSNLWLCMQCGHLGCGRRYYDGSGGNNHGVDHWKETKHSVALKLGTITPEGGASIHCYKCNDDVLDEKLAEHLSKFGIDVATQQKTEKSIAEMNLEANMNLQLSKVIEDGKTLVPMFGPGLTGMENLGNSCYMNSVVQVIFNLPEFRDYYVPTADAHLTGCEKRAPDCPQCQISKLAIGLQSGEYSSKKVAQKSIFEDEEEMKTQPEEYYQDGIRPAIFKTLMGKGHAEFSTGQQQDARQYFSHLLEKFMLNERQWRTGQDPTDAFTFELEQRLQCTRCNRVKYNKVKEQCLHLTLPVASNAEAGTPVGLDACLEATFAEQIIEDFACNCCNAKTTVKDQKRFISFPRNLAVCLKRIVFDDWVPKKLEAALQFDSEANLDLGRFGGGTCELKPGEVDLSSSEEPEMIEPEINQNILKQLVENGIPELAAKHAVYNTKGDFLDDAAMWYFANIDSPVCNTPLMIPNPRRGHKIVTIEPPPSNIKEAFVPDPEAMMLLTSMGFTDQQATRALRKCEGNLERAADWVMCHMDEPDSDDNQGMEVDSMAAVESRFADSEANKGNGNFKLQSFITHLGASIHAGHYVCHARQQDNPANWIYYNDAKVALDTRPPFEKGYMYFFRKHN